jgi:hypothetical protein
MVGRKVGVIPNDEPPKDDVAQAAQPNTGQGDQPNDDAVAAGPGNQLQDNITQPAGKEQKPTMKTGPQPDGELSEVSARRPNQDIEQANEANRSSSID